MNKQTRAQKIFSHLKWDEVMAATDILCGCTDYKGRPIMERYGADPRTLVGFAYMMGVAEGKRRERTRRHS